MIASSVYFLNNCIFRIFECLHRTISRKPGAGSMMVHAWFSSTAALAKTMWTMAISQHQFYLDKKQVEVRQLEESLKSVERIELTGGN